MNKENKKVEPLLLIPKMESYIQYIIELIMKLPRTEKFSIGTEYKNSIYKTLENVMLLNKIEAIKRKECLNTIDTLLNTQRIYLRIMQKNRWIDDKKFMVAMQQIYEIGKILGGLMKYYAKDNQKSI